MVLSSKSNSLTWIPIKNPRLLSAVNGARVLDFYALSVSFTGYSLNISTKEGLVMLSNRKEFFMEVVYDEITK